MYIQTEDVLTPSRKSPTVRAFRKMQYRIAPNRIASSTVLQDVLRTVKNISIYGLKFRILNDIRALGGF